VRRAALIVNPHASGVNEALAAAVLSELSTGGPVEQHLTERPLHAQELAAELGTSMDVIYVLSGDGGYNEVVNGVGPRPAVGFLPGGATSVLPRALGLPRDAVACARRLARAERRRRISLGHVNGRRFTFCAGLGLDAELVRATDQLGRANGRRAHDVAFARELGRILRARHWRVEPSMTVCGHGRAAFVVAANCDPYTYASKLALHAAPEARFELGIDLIGPRELGKAGLAKLGWSLLVHPTHQRSSDYLYLHDLDEAVVECDRPTPLQVDGEDIGDVTQVRLESERDALTVLV
jgi:diacylglycerol kinase family enzyme